MELHASTESVKLFLRRPLGTRAVSLASGCALLQAVFFGPLPASRVLGLKAHEYVHSERPREVLNSIR